MPGYWDMVRMAPQDNPGQGFWQSFLAAKANKRQEQEARLSQERQKQEMELKNDYQVAQREAAAGRPDIMQLGFPEQYQAQQIAQQKLVNEQRQQQIDEAAKIQSMNESVPLLYKIGGQYGYGRGQERAMLADERVRRDLRKANEADLEGTRKGTGNIIQMPGGGVGMPTGAQTAVIGEVRGLDKEINMLDNMNKAIKSAGGHQQLSSIPEAAKAKWGGFLSRINANLVSPDEVKEYGARGAAVAEISTFRNLIFNKLSGAAVSESEMKRLMESVPDINDPWYVREAKMNAWKNNLKMARDAGYDDITKGIQDMSGKMSVGWNQSQPNKDAKGLQLPDGWTVVE